ncbi:thioredoxin family protein [Congregibacter variabilis]|uniref:Thioredoxin family protein n=1 Tax=Congregibacter variabilis TaxID=3081200 RepID=A0ABZ0I6F9_9GAMM|nr:thioredoxin family protein [Congregibacter sp. IMCC43200]
MRSLFTYSLKLLCLVAATMAYATETAELSNPSAYVDSPDPMLDVQRALDRAKSSGKLLLLVMGAQWCHDSTGLVEKFAAPEVASVLANHYETVFVDVGYFKDLRQITRRFDQPHYFATPTVMIVNANTERLINAKDMHIWGSADSVPTQQYLDYFSVYANNPSPQYVPLPDSQASVVSAFEQQNSQRLQEAYEVLVPGMKLEDRTGKAAKEFLKQWGEVRQYRTSLQQDIFRLRRQVQEAPDESLTLPQYEAFSWEQSP